MQGYLARLAVEFVTLSFNGFKSGIVEESFANRYKIRSHCYIVSGTLSSVTLGTGTRGQHALYTLVRQLAGRR